MKRVIAQGTFDLLHPGHVHYLEDAKCYGDRLFVIVARSENITHKQDPIVPDKQRLEMVSALDAVDDARLGHTDDFFVPVRKIDPDVIVLGHDQYHDEGVISDRLSDEGIECSVVRASARTDGKLLSTGQIIDNICERRC